jgi:hypothetical protein
MEGKKARVPARISSANNRRDFRRCAGRLTAAAAFGGRLSSRRLVESGESL